MNEHAKPQFVQIAVQGDRLGHVKQRLILLRT